MLYAFQDIMGLRTTYNRNSERKTIAIYDTNYYNNILLLYNALLTI